MARTMLMQEVTSMVIFQKWRNPMMSTRVSDTHDNTTTQICGGKYR